MIARRRETRGGRKRRRTGRLRRLVGGRKNRRLRAKQPQAPPERVAPPRRRAGALLKGFGVGLARGVLFACKTLLVIAVLGGIGWLGYFGYERALTSTYFDVKKIELDGARHALPADLVALVQEVKGRSIFKVPCEEIARAVATHPWVERAEVQRELPSTLRIKVDEHRSAAAVLLGHVYLVDAAGDVFKRATAGEAEDLPMITGVGRLEYLNDRPRASRRIQRALAVLDRYRRQIRPPLSEVHLGRDGGVTLFLRRSGTALRFGRELTEKRLRQMDAVWAALGPDASRARALYLDHEVRTNRVVVRMGSQEAGR